MNLNEKALWAELKYYILETAVMVNENYTSEEIIANLLKAADLLDNTTPGGDTNAERYPFSSGSC